MNEFLAQLDLAIKKLNLVKLTLSKKKSNKALKNLYAKIVDLSGEKKLAVTFHFVDRDESKIIALDEASTFFAQHLEFEFGQANLFTLTGDFELRISKKGKVHLIRKKAAHKNMPALDHDHQKNYLIEPSVPFLKALGISSSEGNVLSAKRDKYVQIQNFLEQVNQLFDLAQLTNNFKAIDMGSGKHYLTFALHHFLETRFKSDLMQIIGIEGRKKLVDYGNQVVSDLGLSKLSFEKAWIADCPPQYYDLLVALHACDTATDDALVFAIENKIPNILVAPCCQHYLRKNIKLKEHNFSSIVKHGILKEHFSIWLTDALRALTLEYHGYKTKVFEFVSAEHTGRNIMISAQLKAKPTLAPKKLDHINKLKKEFGISDFYLDQKLGMV